MFFEWTYCAPNYDWNLFRQIRSRVSLHSQTIIYWLSLQLTYLGFPTLATQSQGKQKAKYFYNFL